MKTTAKVKQLLRHAAPSVYEKVQEGLTKQRTKYLIKSLTSQIPWVVQAGPFAGMQYVPQAVGSTLIPKLLGCYECELHPTINQILNGNYRKIIDIGCAEGYYAVGLALKNSELRVHAFDLDHTAHELCRKMSELNGVSSRVVIGSECTHEELQNLGGPACLLICDCEGCEFELLQPAKAPSLCQTDLLVELHESNKPGVTRELIARFSATHEIALINSEERNPDDYPILQQFTRLNQRVALTEFRDEGMQWAFMTAKVGT